MDDHNCNGTLTVRPSVNFYSCCATEIGSPNSPLKGIIVSMQPQRRLSISTGKYYTGAQPDKYIEFNVNNWYIIQLAYDDDQQNIECNQFITRESDGRYKIMFNETFFKFLSRELQCENVW